MPRGTVKEKIENKNKNKANKTIDF